VPENIVRPIAPIADEPSNAVVIKSNAELPQQVKTEVAPASAPTSNATTNDNGDSPSDNPGFWEKNKKWLKPVAIGVGGLIIIGIGYSMMKGSKTQNKSSPPSKGLSGTPHSRKRKNQKRHKTKHHKKKAVALL